MASSADVIIVLGAALRPDGSPSPALERRVARGVRAFREGLAPHLLLSGGAVRHARPEAEAMAALALAQGVPAGNIVQEPRSANTFENALHCRLMMEERAWRRAVVVTDSFHMPRALFVFRRLGIPAVGCRVEGRGGESRWRWAVACLREVAALARSATLFAMGRDRAGIAAARRRFRRPM
ncbi:MAG: YdcF family protein [Magnetospirillum sp. WYHS-4]